MIRFLRRFALVTSLIVAVGIAPELKLGPANWLRAQMRVVPLDDQQGHVALGLALRHLSNAGIFMQATAHPDDENNGLLVMLNRGQGYRTTLATATRGNGGQNEIGPEIFEALGVLRTEELAALHRFDGAEQYFGRAVDFGYSFSIEETMEKWGRDEIIGDFVHLIRMVRPDVVIAQNPDGTGGGLHHQTTSLLSREAFKQAGDPTKYPEQVRGGLRAWQPKKFYIAAGRGGGPGGPGGGAPPAQPRQVSINLAVYDPLLGRTYSEIGTEARSMHKCQGQAQLLALPGPSATSYQLVETVIPGQVHDERSLFDDLDSTITGLAQFAGPRPPRDLTSGLAVIASAVQSAQRRFDSEGDEATLQPLLTGLAAVRGLRSALRALSIDEAGRFEIDFRLRQKEGEFQQAILMASSVRVEALADDGVVVPGQPVRVSLIVANRGATDVSVKGIKFDGFEGISTCTLTAGVGGGPGGGPGGGRGRGGSGPTADATPVSVLKKDQVARCTPTLTVPAAARVTEPYWHRAGDAGRYTFDADAPFGLPYRPTPFYAQVTLGFTGREDVFAGLPIQYRYEGNIFSGEKRADLLVVPPFSVRVSPEIAIFPAFAVGSSTASAGQARGAAGSSPASAGQARGATSAGQARGSAGAATPGPARGATSPTPASAGAGPARGSAPVAGRAGAAAGAAAASRTGAAARPGREIRVTVVNDSKGPADNVINVELPAGWSASPAEQAIKFTREDEAQTVRFQIVPAPTVAPGVYHLKASVTAAGVANRRGYQVIEYPHIRRQHIYHDADVTMKVLDVKTAPNLAVGYIMGTGDEVPAAIEQLGAKVTLLQRDDLAWGDLSRFGTIVTGIRAYEQREDLIANNSRLLDYVRNGGTLIVQYNKDAFNAAQYGPYPAVVTGERVTDENAPVTVLTPSDPFFNVPNKITDATWRGWIQERGVYFLGERDSRYRDLVQLEDPFPNNRGVKRGALVDASYGKGRWVYVGLGIWRELSVGVDGAYALLANLISIGK